MRRSRVHIISDPERSQVFNEVRRLDLASGEAIDGSRKRLDMLVKCDSTPVYEVRDGKEETVFYTFFDAVAKYNGL